MKSRFLACVYLILIILAVSVVVHTRAQPNRG